MRALKLLEMRSKSVFFLISLLASNYIQSQLEKRSSYDVKSPNVSDFIRYGNIPVKMYTGELDFSLPLLKQDDIDLSLSYNSCGFIPNKRSGIVGLNWNVNGLGIITRELKGIPDDHIGSPGTIGGVNGRTGHGFMVGLQYLKNAGAILPNGGITDNPVVIDYEIRHRDAGGGISDSFETTPDIFHFNINGLSGKFFMTSDGKIKVISNSPNIVTVDISNLNFQPYTVNCSPINSSEFKLIDDQGNKYYFGGESKYLEYSLSYNKASQGTDGESTNPIINAWHIKRIEYYNGNITNYNYQDDEIINGSTSFCNSNPAASWFKVSRSLPLYKRLFFITESVNDSRSMITQNGITNSTGGMGNIYTLHKKVFLESITGNNFNIYFTYSPQGFFFNNNPILFSFFKNIDEYKLDKITLQCGSQVIKELNFTYSLKGGNTNAGSYPRLFLDSFHETGKSPYQFEYHILPSQNLPVPSTCAIDFWSFFNGKLTNDAPPFGYAQLIPQSITDSNGNETFISEVRNSNFDFSKIGMLKKVIYPTKGYSEFEYEPHTYSKRLDRKSNNNFLPALVAIQGQAGGIRIKKIIDFDGLQATNIKEYLYSNLDNSSSGILMQWPRTGLVYNYQTNCASCWHNGMWFDGYYTNSDIAKSQSSSINMNSIENSVMTYSRVIEKTTNNGYKIYNFKGYANYPDDNNYSNLTKLLKAGNLCGDVLNETFSPENLVKNFYVLPNDRSIERGKLENILIYDNNNNLLVKEEYFYNTDINRFNSYSQFGVESNTWWYKAKQYYYNDFLTEKKITEFTAAGNIITTIKSTYISAPSYNTTLISNQDILLKKSITTSINNEELETRYQYPWDIYANTTTEYADFINANITIPLRESVFRNNVKINENFTEYKKDVTTGNKLLPKNIYSAKFPNSFSNIPNIGNLEKKSTIDFYDNRGNVLQYTLENGVPVTLIWGYNQSLLIAKIENATKAQVQTALSISDLNAINETNMATIDALRTNISFSNSSITTYTHKPLVGILTIKDSKGDIQTYEYDANSRLKIIKDRDGKILNEYQYHYKN